MLAGTYVKNSTGGGRGLREEVSAGFKSTNETLFKTLENKSKLQQNQLDDITKQLSELTESNREALDRIRTTFDTCVKELQEENEKKLEEMRKTVDEKLHDTLGKHLGESFKLVSERLEAVQKGLGEVQNRDECRRPQTGSDECQSLLEREREILAIVEELDEMSNNNREDEGNHGV